ncbi:glycosyltransferase [Belliella sp. R4-6]|uniref:Glycosyltransferase n=1 Tax=Belliella alkalica TaxID=1730871 RepID=A0ABS9V928_9BACT|nr:glycosyltransferase family A protein [Belliella alkalica]MCH7412908.1 glycosyltransferase [Belliella alkalica]
MINNQPLVSVIIPCFNHQDYIQETVSSVLQSSYPKVEIIIVNDGSTDKSGEVIRSLENEYENILGIEQKNAGPSAARNAGISKAKGTIILPLDGDDLISKDYILEAVDTFFKSENIKLVYCKAEKFGKKNGPWKLKPFSLESLAKDNMIFVSAMFKKEDWLSVGGFDVEMRGGWEDWEFWISLLKSGGEVVQLPFVGFYYRTAEKSRRKIFSKKGKNKTIDYLNQKHKDFFFKYLNGPLHHQRSLSNIINKIKSIFANINIRNNAKS